MRQITCVMPPLVPRNRFPCEDKYMLPILWTALNLFWLGISGNHSSNTNKIKHLSNILSESTMFIESGKFLKIS